MMRAVLDTNVVMSAIFFGGVPFDVLNAWHNGEFELVVSDAVMAEYREIAARMKAKFAADIVWTLVRGGAQQEEINPGAVDKGLARERGQGRFAHVLDLY